MRNYSHFVSFVIAIFVTQVTLQMTQTQLVLLLSTEQSDEVALIKGLFVGVNGVYYILLAHVKNKFTSSHYSFFALGLLSGLLHAFLLLLGLFGFCLVNGSAIHKGDEILVF